MRLRQIANREIESLTDKSSSMECAQGMERMRPSEQVTMRAPKTEEGK
jgi:hypothetical protein